MDEPVNESHALTLKKIAAQKAALAKLNGLVDDIMKEKGFYTEDPDEYTKYIKAVFGKKMPNPKEPNPDIVRLANEREALLSDPDLRAAVENSGANFTLVGWDADKYKDVAFQDLPLDAIEMYLLERQVPNKGAVGAIGGLSERVPKEKFDALSPLAKQVLISMADPGKPDKIERTLKKAIEECAEDTKRHGTKNPTRLYGYIARRDLALADAVKELTAAEVYEYKGKPINLFDMDGDPASHRPKGIEFLMGGKDDVVCAPGTSDPIIEWDLDKITLNNRTREGHEEVGDIGISVAKAQEQGRLIEVNMTGVRDDDWIVRTKGAVLGDPRLSMTDYAVSPKVGILTMTSEERASVRRKKMQATDEIEGYKSYTPAQALARAVFDPKEGGYEYTHEAFAVMAVIRKWAQGDLSKLQIIKQQVQKAINDMARERGIDAPLFSFTALAKKKRIDGKQLSENLDLPEESYQAILATEAEIERYSAEIENVKDATNQLAVQDHAAFGTSVAMGGLSGRGLIGSASEVPAKERAMLVFVDPYSSARDPKDRALAGPVAEYRRYVARAPKVQEGRPGMPGWNPNLAAAKHNFMTDPWISGPNADGVRVIMVPTKSDANHLIQGVVRGLKYAEVEGIRHVDLLPRDVVECDPSSGRSIGKGISEYVQQPTKKPKVTSSVIFPTEYKSGSLETIKNFGEFKDALWKNTTTLPPLHIAVGEQHGIDHHKAHYDLKPEQRAIVVPAYIGGSDDFKPYGLDDNAEEVKAFKDRNKGVFNLGEVWSAPQQPGRPLVIFASTRTYRETGDLNDPVTGKDIETAMANAFKEAQEKGVRHIDVPFFKCYKEGDKAYKTEPKYGYRAAEAIATAFANHNREGAGKKITLGVSLDAGADQKNVGQCEIYAHSLTEALKRHDVKDKASLKSVVTFDTPQSREVPLTTIAHDRVLEGLHALAAKEHAAGASR